MMINDAIMSEFPDAEFDQGGIIPDNHMKREIRKGRFGGRLMFWSRGGDNFGDYIGPYLFRKSTGELPIFARSAIANPSNPTYFTCGSILEKISNPNSCIVWGSGRYIWHGAFSRPKAVHAVRGPLSLEYFYRHQYAAPEVFGDPGLCVPLFYSPDTTKHYRVGFIPHLSEIGFWSEAELPDDVALISPSGTVEEVVRKIVAAERIVSSSLHGVVLAHAYGIPAAWALPTTRRLVGGGLKFCDYFGGIGETVLPSEGARLSGPADIHAVSEDGFVPSRDLGLVAKRLLNVCPFIGHKVP